MYNSKKKAEMPFIAAFRSFSGVAASVLMMWAVMFSGCNDVEEQPSVTSTTSAFAVSNNSVEAGGLVEILGPVGENPELVEVYQEEMALKLVAFVPNVSVIAEVPASAISGELSLMIAGKCELTDFLEILINRIRPVFWVEESAYGPKIMKGEADLAGNTSKTTLYETENIITAMSISVLKNKVYWAEFSFDDFTTSVYAVSFNGGTPEPVLSSRGNIAVMKVSDMAGKIFFSEVDSTLNTGLYTANLQGSNVQSIYMSGIVAPTELEYDFTSNTLLYVEASGQVVAAPVNGSGLSTVYASTNFRKVGGLAVNELTGSLFVADLGKPGDESDVIYQGSTDGMAALDTVCAAIPGSAFNPVFNTVAMDVDRIGNFLYWLNSSAITTLAVGNIYRLKLSGSTDPELVFENIGLSSSADVKGRSTGTYDKARLAL